MNEAEPKVDDAVANHACTASRLLPPPAPAWAVRTGLENVPYILADPNSAGVAIFPLRYPLVAVRRPDGSNNKVIWVSQGPIQKLHVYAHPHGAYSPVVKVLAWSHGTTDQCPGIVNLPAPGCWHFSIKAERHYGEFVMHVVASEELYPGRMVQT